MIEGVMSIMEGDEGIDKQKYKELLLFSKGGEDRKIEGQRIHRNSKKFREKKILRKNIEKYYWILLKKI